ncbi:hypothetical protein MSP8886_02736 [Marinomonas spartinae]|uniref:DUF3574 domain-containing protein n=1 Tax=Marinomonas spartinae TaxID=1792290 RepID=A0A1A8TI96_9GAMM|nr:DUF3574 domain-containing protein [Marinomonas spartinae]SBS33381.1 hypothetical protein MSP8886_02736 [Marinomonas spartinae]
MQKSYFRRSVVVGVFSVAVLGMSGCAQMGSKEASAAPTMACTVGDQMQQTTLYFGMSRPAGGVVTEAQWQGFVDKEVTPRFRDGLTVFAAKGQWLGNDGKVAKEDSRALMLIYPTNDKASNKKIEALRNLYRKQFQQESVMRVDSPECVSF